MSSVAPTLSIQYSREFEYERVRNVYKKEAWYREHGYNARLPGEQRLPDLLELPPLAEMLGKVDAEYDDGSYTEMVNAIRKGWAHIQEQWPKEAIRATTLTFEPAYTIHLTKYGVGGSYDIPNTIVLNIASRNIELLPKIICHEMIHLCIEPLVQQYATPHWYKERIVDLTFKRLFPEIAFEQNLSKEVLVIDPVFEQHYSNFEEIFAHIPRET